MERSSWPSRWVFILAAIGSAAGLGNLWRFPYLAYENGGAAFVIAIIIANFVIGIPLLLFEVGIGQMKQKGAPDALGAIKPIFRYIGWLALVFGFIVLSYYMSVMAWGIDYLGSAFTLAWAGNSQDFFFNTVLQISSGVNDIGGISWPVFAGFLFAWALVYFSVWKGVKSVSPVVKVTVTLPFVILLLLIFRAVTLPGAMEGLKLFFVPEWGALLNPKLWLAAFSQVFFSLSIAFGIMIAYGSLKPHSEELGGSVLWVAAGNFLVSLLSGIAVFGTLGYMAHIQNIPVADVVAGGPGLAFVVLPLALSLLPTLAIIFSVLYFIMFASLAIDSAFSLLEGFAIPFRDRMPHLSTKKVALIISIIVAMAGIPFTTKAGLYYLDIIDHFVVNYGLVIVGLLEVLVVGWLWRGSEFQKYVNAHSKIKIGRVFNILVKAVIPLFLTFLLVWNIINEFKTPYEGYPTSALIGIGVVPLILAPLVALILDKVATRWNNGE